MYQPVVDTNDWTVTDIDDEGFVTLMDDDGNQKKTFNSTRIILDPELGEKLRLPLKTIKRLLLRSKVHQRNQGKGTNGSNHFNAYHH